MREIKFRAWLPSINKMVEVFELSLDTKRITHKTITNSMGKDYRTTGFIYCEIMQFTGLFDKKGIEIYEGDIVVNLHKHIYPIEWKQEIAAFNIDNWESRECEVIGNIYENKELLS
jgi:uncharacterized phage protein (TIGR01671 family)